MFARFVPILCNAVKRRGCDAPRAVFHCLRESVLTFGSFSARPPSVGGGLFCQSGNANLRGPAARRAVGERKSGASSSWLGGIKSSATAQSGGPAGFISTCAAGAQCELRRAPL